MNCRVQFRNPDAAGYVLASGKEELYFTSKEFRWDDINSNWFLVGFIRYSDKDIGGIERVARYGGETTEAGHRWPI